MKPNLTIIIPFLNEGEEIARTVSSVRETTKGNVNIILINDCSFDNYDYRSIAKTFDCEYIYHSVRNGVAGSRNEGVERCQTPFFILLDGHMRFYEQGWNCRLEELLKQYPRTVLCGRSKVLRINENNEVVDTIEPNTYGAFIELYVRKMFSAAWSFYDYQAFTNLSEIPCILGAAYAMSKSYWQLLRGVEGLLTYGSDEELLSMKVWREGGKCLLIKDWVVGHIYRDQFPYQIYDKEILYNKLYVMELMFPNKEKSLIFSQMKKALGDAFTDAYTLLKQNYKQVSEMKEYLQRIENRNIEEFLLFNNLVQKKNETKKQKIDV